MGFDLWRFIVVVITWSWGTERLGSQSLQHPIPYKQIQDIAKKARQKIALFRRCFTGFDEEKVTIFLKSFIRPALEYASSAWSPLTEGNNYYEITRECAEKLPTPVHRRHYLCKRGRRTKTDLIETYKFMINGFYKTPGCKFFLPPLQLTKRISKKWFVWRTKTIIGRPLLLNSGTNFEQFARVTNFCMKMWLHSRENWVLPISEDDSPINLYQVSSIPSKNL